MSKRLIGLCAGLFLLGMNACTRNTTLAEVGSTKIEKKDVELRVKAISALSGKIDEKTALEQLINSYTLAEALKTKSNVNLEAAADEELKKMSELNGENSFLAKVKPIFSGDTNALKKIVVAPLLVSKLAYVEGYLKDEEFHKARKQQAEDFLNEVLKKPAAFEEIATKSGVHFQKGSISPSNGLVWGPSADTSLLPSGIKIAETWKKAALDTTAAGKIAPKLVEEERAWVILKNLGTSSKEKGTTEILTAVVSKPPFDTWLQMQKEKVSVKIIARN